MRIYLAGPDVFFPDARAQGERKKALVRAAGHEPLFPLDAQLDADFAHDAKPDVARAIFASNCGLIESCNLVAANLTPFRGPSADAGTVWEIGYASGLGKPVWGYSNVAAPFAERSRVFVRAAPDGLDVEDFELESDNLMIHFALAGFAAIQSPPDERWTDLASFEAILAAIAAAIS